MYTCTWVCTHPDVCISLLLQTHSCSVCARGCVHWIPCREHSPTSFTHLCAGPGWVPMENGPVPLCHSLVPMGICPAPLCHAMVPMGSCPVPLCHSLVHMGICPAPLCHSLVPMGICPAPLCHAMELLQPTTTQRANTLRETDRPMNGNLLLVEGSRERSRARTRDCCCPAAGPGLAALLPCCLAALLPCCLAVASLGSCWQRLPLPAA